MTVEMVIAVPGFLLLLLLIVLGANWVSAGDQVGAAARDAVRAASLARSGGAAQQAAMQAAGYDLGHLCIGTPSVQVTTSGGTSFANAQQVSVRVGCVINLKVFTILGVSAQRLFTSQSVAPLDPYVFRTS